MSHGERENKIKSLTNAQAISLARLIKDTIVLTRLPKGYSLDNIYAVDAVYELCKESDYKEIDKEEIDMHIKQADEDAVGSAARDFLLFISTTGDKDLLQQLDEELDNPAQELTAVIEPMSLLMVIFGGIALLNVVSNIRYKNGKFEYDPERGKDVSKQNVNAVIGILKAVIPFGSKDKSNL
jgi:hypothetical protein